MKAPRLLRNLGTEFFVPKVVPTIFKAKTPKTACFEGFVVGL